MAKCVRCRVELVGTARFCASCGAPVPDASATTMEPHISIPVLDPGLPVNPFASTASPDSIVNPFATTKKPSLVDKPSEPPPVAATPISPLATSASLPDRGAFEELIASAQAEPKPVPAAAPTKKKAPGTQMMTNAPARPSSPAPAPVPASAPAKKPVARTVAMGNWPTPKPASVPPQALPNPAPSAPRMPASGAAPSAVASSASASSGHGSSPVVPSAQPSYPHPSGPGGWGWNAPQPSPRPVVPGARVTVTWSNGQRYPATVNQINGPRCLVVFPDGQQHWVETQFVTAV